ncbi:MAG: hypothetical protein ACI4KM_04340 [Oscillospiraceae bacterium]
MAVGDGGFKQVPFGFDKNEVNEYISELRKKMSANEAEMKANDAKTKEALKLAEEAESRINAAVSEVQAKLDEANTQLAAEKHTSEDLKSQVETLKKKIADENKKMSDMLRSGEGVSAKAKEAYTEIIDKANADAAEIIKKAQESADEILANAQASKQQITENLDKFLAAVREQIELMTSGFGSIAQTASELIGTEIAVPETVIPEVTDAAPASAKAAEKPEPKAEAEVKPAEVKAEEKKTEPKQEAKKPEKKAEPKPEPKPAPKKAEEPVKDKPEDDMPVAKAEPRPADFESDVWGGAEIAAQNIYSQQQSNGGVPLVNPEAQSNPFGDLFDTDSSDGDMTDSIDMSGFAPQESAPAVSEVAPLDVSDHAEVAMNDDFATDLISQTMASGSGDGMDDDLMAALRAAEEAFAVQPSEGRKEDVVTAADIAMENAAAAAEEEEDDLMKALREAEAALAGTDSSDAPAQAVEEAPAEDDPWADLQRQLEAMEQDGSLTEENQDAAADANTQTDSADNSSLWDFGSADGGSSDDDMSSDAFGGFGGF